MAMGWVMIIVAVGVVVMMVTVGEIVMMVVVMMMMVVVVVIEQIVDLIRRLLFFLGNLLFGFCLGSTGDDPTVLNEVTSSPGDDFLQALFIALGADF